MSRRTAAQLTPILSMLALVNSSGIASAQAPSPRPLHPDWRMVAQSDLIVRAGLDVPSGRMKRPSARRNPNT